MIRRFFCTFLMLVLLCSGAHAEDMKNLIRLHVVAADNSAEAQALKLELRDTCLECARACLWDAPDSESAYMRLQSHTDDFENACRLRARELGYSGSITAETGVFEFPDRIYGKLKVPAGDYHALRITIGEGNGHNWWCILYPSLCLIDEADASSGETNPQNILNWLRARIGGK